MSVCLIPTDTERQLMQERAARIQSAHRKRQDHTNGTVRTDTLAGLGIWKTAQHLIGPGVDPPPDAYPGQLPIIEQRYALAVHTCQDKSGNAHLLLCSVDIPKFRSVQPRKVAYAFVTYDSENTPVLTLHGFFPLDLLDEQAWDADPRLESFADDPGKRKWAVHRRHLTPARERHRPARAEAMTGR